MRATPGLIAAAAALAGLALPALPAAAAPLAGSPCATGTLVDAAFRDAALAAFERLVVRAPGQPADGALRTHQSAGHVDAQGRAWAQVSAYQANLGLLGVLHAAPRLLPVAADWLRWQARHIPDTGPHRGVVLDHWVRADGAEQSRCPPGLAPGLCDAVDAFDSTAASTLLVAEAYQRHGGDLALLREPAMRRALEAAATALGALAGPDGLTLAKPAHPVAYTMDAVEVIAGWRAWARLQHTAYAQPQSALNSLGTATQVEARLQQRLWDERASAWHVNLGADAPQPLRWYPDTVAQAWPLLWGTGIDVGVDGRTPAPAAQAARAQRAWRQAIARWPGWAGRTNDPAGFWWPAVAVAAHCSGDVPGARQWVARARAQWLDPRSPFAWPFQVGDLLWLLWLAEPQAAQRPGATAPAPAAPSST